MGRCTHTFNTRDRLDEIPANLPSPVLSPSFLLSPLPLGQNRAEDWSSVIGSEEVTVSERSDVWNPVIGPGEVTVTDVTINSLTVTFREALAAKGFFRGWGLEF